MQDLLGTAPVLGTQEEPSEAYIGALVLGGAIALGLCKAISDAALSLKRVRLLRDGLEISNYRVRVRVPFEAIADVIQSTWTGTITVHFRAPTLLGRSVTFQPAETIRAPWRAHPLVSELRRYASLARDAAGRA